jgi:hypothetical protein
MELLIYTHDKTYLVHLDSKHKKELKQKLFNYQCLYEYFNEVEENKYRHFLTTYKKKCKYGWGVDVKMYLRRNTKHLHFDDAQTIETFNVRYSIDGYEHNFLKKYPKNEVIGIKMKEDTNLIHFYVVLKHDIPQNFISLKVECCVCYGKNKQTKENGFFECVHNELCNNCYYKLQSKRCPICRSS